MKKYRPGTSSGTPSFESGRYALQPALLDWQRDTPVSRDFDDVYFSSEDGLAESDYVFLQGNALPERWNNHNRPDFVIAETGFGSGLNFLLTVQAWLDQPDDGKTLHYIGIEKHPLSHTDLERTLSRLTARWPQLADHAEALLDGYPPLIRGMHTITLFNGRIRLLLIFDDIERALQQWHTPGIDAWYLDGFAPAKNPAMWQAGMFRDMARLSRPGATFATFTAAGQVRRDLQCAGFAVEKYPGFGRKRDMLRGKLDKAHKTGLKKPWFAPPPPATEKKAIVIGAGMAGVTTAWTLTKRGWQITLLERASTVAQGASGNPAGIVMPLVTHQWHPESELSLRAFLYACRQLRQLRERIPDLPWHNKGVLQLMDDEKRDRIITESGLHETLLYALDRQQAGDCCGMDTHSGGLFFPNAGWMDPAAVCRSLLKEAGENIETILHHEAIKLQQTDNSWRIETSRGETLHANTVILANAHDAAHLLPDHVLPLQQVRGQLANVPATDNTRALKIPVCQEGYVIPEWQGEHCIGATFDRDDMDRSLREDDQEKLFRQLQQFIDFPLSQTAPLKGRVAFRTTSPDHLPLLGPVADEDFYRHHYNNLQHGRHISRYPRARYLPGLYLNISHGSRGLTSSWLCAETLACMLEGTPLPLSMDMIQRMHPARFLISRLKRYRDKKASH